jgi:hypothetical protein
MLQTPAPFPYQGSYALLEHEGRTQLVRIVMRREGEVVVSFPLRDGAGGNLRVDPAKLIDGTPLTQAEEREFHDLDRQIDGRTFSDLSKQLRVKAKRRTALKHRLIWSRFMAPKVAEAERLAALGTARSKAA